MLFSDVMNMLCLPRPTFWNSMNVEVVVTGSKGSLCPSCLTSVTVYRKFSPL